MSSDFLLILTCSVVSVAGLTSVDFVAKESTRVAQILPHGEVQNLDLVDDNVHILHEGSSRTMLGASGKQDAKRGHAGRPRSPSVSLPGIYRRLANATKETTPAASGAANGKGVEDVVQDDESPVEQIKKGKSVEELQTWMETRWDRFNPTEEILFLAGLGVSIIVCLQCCCWCFLGSAKDDATSPRAFTTPLRRRQTDTDLTMANQQKAVLISQAASMKEEKERCQLELQQAQSSQHELGEKLASVEADLRDAEQRNTALDVANKTEQDKKASLEAELRDTGKKQAMLAYTNDTLEAAKVRLTTKLDEAVRGEREAKEALAAIEAELLEMKAANDDLSAHVATLEAEAEVRPMPAGSSGHAGMVDDDPEWSTSDARGEKRRHTLKAKTFKGSSYCSKCEAFLWGMSEQGVQCTTCDSKFCHTCKIKVKLGVCPGSRSLSSSASKLPE